MMGRSAVAAVAVVPLAGQAEAAAELSNSKLYAVYDGQGRPYVLMLNEGNERRLEHAVLSSLRRAMVRWRYAYALAFKAIA